jgi:hypothetical protein
LRSKTQSSKMAWRPFLSSARDRSGNTADPPGPAVHPWVGRSLRLGSCF